MVLRDPEDLTLLLELPELDFVLDLTALLLLRFTRLVPFTVLPLLPCFTLRVLLTEGFELFLFPERRFRLTDLFSLLGELILVLPIIVVLFLFLFLLEDLILLRRTFSSPLFTDVFLVLSRLLTARIPLLPIVLDEVEFLRIRLTLEVFIPPPARAVIIGTGILFSWSIPRRRSNGLRLCGLTLA